MSIDSARIDYAAALLDAGEIVAFPTETVYGLGGDAQNPAALARIYAAKGRPANHPVIVHLPPDGDPGYWAAAWPRAAQRLAQAFWPGPLTLIVRRAARIPDAVSGGQDSVGLRCPSHPVAQALLATFAARCARAGRYGGQGGVAAPSANRFGHVSPTTAQHVRDEFGAAIHVLDGGASGVGIESTIVDLSRGFPALLRPGHVSAHDLAQVLGEVVRLPDGADASAPRASGTLKAHYAPRTPLVLLPFDALEPLLAARADRAGRADRAHGSRNGRNGCDGNNGNCANNANAGNVTDAANIMNIVNGAHDVDYVHGQHNPPVALVARASRAKAWADAPGVRFIAAPEDPHTYARELYGLLRVLDCAHVTHILIEKLPDTAEWAAVNDRLGRAAAAFDGQEIQSFFRK